LLFGDCVNDRHWANELNGATTSLAARQPLSESHLAFLDGLRAVAVLLVVVCHAAKYTMDFHQGWPFHAMFEGAHGVDLFFVISGFCLSLPFLARLKQSRATPFDLTTFFSRRIVRIIPPYWVVFALLLAIALLVRKAGGDLPWPTIKLPTSAADGVRQLFFLTPGNNLCGSFWTLAVEFRWYIAFPAILWLYTRWRPFALVAAVSSITAYSAIPMFHYWDFATLPGFLLGIVAADCVINSHPICRYALALFPASILAALALEPHGHLDYALQDQWWWQLPGFFLVIAGASQPVLKRLLSSRPMVSVGLASYSIYLTHDPIEAWYGHYGGQSPILAIVAALLIGFACWMLVERYFTTKVNRDRLVSILNRAIAPAVQRFNLRNVILLGQRDRRKSVPDARRTLPIPDRRIAASALVDPRALPLTG
jgi:peptidoglycan/LPS O-acetylase OafA/YrhL